MTIAEYVDVSSGEINSDTVKELLADLETVLQDIRGEAVVITVEQCHDGGFTATYEYKKSDDLETIEP